MTDSCLPVHRGGIVPGIRLGAAMELLSSCRVLADIGSDHGRLPLAMLQQGRSERCIACDISADSLEKARLLSGHVGLTDRMDFRVGDGLKVLSPGEADAISILGMGGTLMAEILSASPVPLMRAERCVLQPMRAQDDIRTYLYHNGYPILEDRVVREGGRLYQVFLIGRPDGQQDPWPDGFPEDCFTVGYLAFQNRDPLTRDFALRELEQARKRLKTASGTRGEAILRVKERQMTEILGNWGR